MHWFDWLLVMIPIVVVTWIGLRAQHYVHGVADFLSAGRVAGRYVLSVSSGMASMGLITLLGFMELYYRTGMTVAFWEMLKMPFIFFISMTGFCVYRFRETRAMTMGQFFEMRYSRRFRLTAAVIQSAAGIINYAIFPAVGARFLVWYMDLPAEFLGAPTAMWVMACFLAFAVTVAMMGGQVTVMVTDCVQGLFSYPMFLALIIFFAIRFAWFEDVVPTLWYGSEATVGIGKSMLNPLDSYKLDTFNLFYVFVGIFGMFIGHMTWAGTSGYNCSARNPHEAKMGGMIGRLRENFSTFMYVILALFAFVFMRNLKFDEEASIVRENVAMHAAAEVVSHRAETAPTQTDTAEVMTEAYTAPSPDILPPPADFDKAETRSYESLVRQMTPAMALRQMLPVGLVGVFCVLCIFLLVSTDTTYLHSWGTILVQDLVMPLIRRPLSPKTQIWILRGAILLVALIAFIFSSKFAQFDFIIMFFQVTGALWAGAGAVITLGLYWSRGTTQGAFAALFVGASIALSGWFLQMLWPTVVYPFLEAQGWVPAVQAFCDSVTQGTNHLLNWSPANFAKDCPIKSTEILFSTNIFALLTYIVVSLVTCRKPFPMDKLLHRGKWAIASDAVETHSPEAPRRGWIAAFAHRILGIDSAYTKRDKALAWGVWLWTFGGYFLCGFIGVLIWNMISPWEMRGWGWYSFITIFLGAAFLGVVFTVWFGICGIRDLRQLFRSLAQRKEDITDDGHVDALVDEPAPEAKA
jgi:SSS family solute:Na+ symporter